MFFEEESQVCRARRVSLQCLDSELVGQVWPGFF